MELAEVPIPACGAGGVLVRSHFSLISVGTERTSLEFGSRSLVGKARGRPDLVKQVLQKASRNGIVATLQTVRDQLDRYMPLGYSVAGTVIDVGSGVDDIAIGDRVACAGAEYASHAEYVHVPRNLVAKVPAGLPDETAAFATLGAIALHGVRNANTQLGDWVAVIGLGLLGQITVQLLKAAGCRVLGVDVDHAKLEKARECGADIVIKRHGLEKSSLDIVPKRGVDSVIVTASSKSSDPLELAGFLARDRATVVMVGAVGMTVPRNIFFKKELSLRVSRSYGPGRYDPQYEKKGISYPVGYVPWTERDNLEAFLRLAAVGSIRTDLITTHTFDLDEALSAYALVRDKSGAALGILLRYNRQSDSTNPTRPIHTRTNIVAGKTQVAFIGAGNFASKVLIPRFAKHSVLHTVVTRGSVSAFSAQRAHGFANATTDVSSVLDDPGIHVVVVATEHSSHADIAVRAIEAGKAVFVEKPLALTLADLARVRHALEQHGGYLAVGYNRRFSPLAAELRAQFDSHRLSVNYRVNAGTIATGSWIIDAHFGGGRIIGEACHFVDLIQYLTDSKVTSVCAQGSADPTSGTEEVAATFGTGNGSIATLLYSSSGSPSYAKERVEVFGSGAVGIIDDFKTLRTTTGVKRSGWQQQKGFDQEVDAFFSGLRSGKPPIDYDSLFSTSLSTFCMLESIRSRRVEQVSVEDALRGLLQPEIAVASAQSI